MNQERDNLKAGLFVVVGIVLALVIVFVLTDFRRLFDRKQTVMVSYKLSDGLKGLKIGAEVTLGDQPVGEVVEIADQFEPGTDRVIGKHVVFTMSDRYKLFTNAVIEAKAPAIGSGTKLNIRSVGDDRPYKEDMVIDGSVAGSELTHSLVTDMGIEDLQRQQLRTIIANIEAITTQVSADLPEITGSIKRMLAKTEPLIDQARTALEDVERITASTRDILATAQAVLKDKEPAIRASIDNVQATTANAVEITEQVKEKTLAQVSEALAKADAAMANVKKATEELKALAVGQRPVLERTLANLQLTADQLKLASIEVRRSPWRLLYRPGDEELETDNLYDAARSFAQAAGTLDAAAQSLRAVTASAQAEDAETVKLMIQHLETLFARYQEAETGFWKAINERTAR